MNGRYLGEEAEILVTVGRVIRPLPLWLPPKMSTSHKGGWSPEREIPERAIASPRPAVKGVLPNGKYPERAITSPCPTVRRISERQVSRTGHHQLMSHSETYFQGRCPERAITSPSHTVRRISMGGIPNGPSPAHPPAVRNTSAREISRTRVPGVIFGRRVPPTLAPKNTLDLEICLVSSRTRRGPITPAPFPSSSSLLTITLRGNLWSEVLRAGSIPAFISVPCP